jgi:2-polyprenyl-3-methyl-5-hydroxy-6-metoxy-1,4-benzoquinol methylase
MNVHELLRPAKPRWRLLRDTRDYESVRRGYNQLELSIPEENEASIGGVSYYVQLRKALASLPKTVAILDAGCGAGVTCRELRKLGYSSLTAFDISDENVRKASAYASRVYRAVCEEIPEPADSFDVVICNGVIEHVIDVDKSICEMARVLRPCGLLYLMTDNALWQSLTVLRNVLVPKHRRYRRLEQPLDGDFSPWEMRRHLRQGGFENIRYCGFGALPVASRWLERIIGQSAADHAVLKYLTGRMILTATKGERRLT